VPPGLFRSSGFQVPYVASDFQVPYVDEGLEAIVFTADGDMRQALNNLQVGRLLGCSRHHHSWKAAGASLCLLP
jgi:hypothetical protein